LGWLGGDHSMSTVSALRARASTFIGAPEGTAGTTSRSDHVIHATMMSRWRHACRAGLVRRATTLGRGNRSTHD